MLVGRQHILVGWHAVAALVELLQNVGVVGRLTVRFELALLIQPFEARTDLAVGAVGVVAAGALRVESVLAFGGIAFFCAYMKVDPASRANAIAKC